jgi:hypothetical protein
MPNASRRRAFLHGRRRIMLLPWTGRGAHGPEIKTRKETSPPAPKGEAPIPPRPPAPAGVRRWRPTLSDGARRGPSTIRPAGAVPERGWGGHMSDVRLKPFACGQARISAEENDHVRKFAIFQPAQHPCHVISRGRGRVQLASRTSGRSERRRSSRCRRSRSKRRQRRAARGSARRTRIRRPIATDSRAGSASDFPGWRWGTTRRRKPRGPLPKPSSTSPPERS